MPQCLAGPLMGMDGNYMRIDFGQITVKYKNGAKYVLVGTLLIAAAFYFYGHTHNYYVYALCISICAAVACGYSLWPSM